MTDLVAAAMGVALGVAFFVGFVAGWFMTNQEWKRVFDKPRQPWRPPGSRGWHL